MAQDQDDLGAITIAEFCRRYGISQSKLYLMLSAGELKAVKVGRRTLLLKRDIRAWERRLPAMAS